MVLMLAACMVCPNFLARGQQSVITHPISRTDAGTILGQRVFDSAGEDVGPLVDVLVNNTGVPIAGVVDVGGFLAVGTRQVAIAWRLFHFGRDDDGTRIQMDLTFDAVAAAPEYQSQDNSLIVIDRPPP